MSSGPAARRLPARLCVRCGTRRAYRVPGLGLGGGQLACRLPAWPCAALTLPRSDTFA